MASSLVYDDAFYYLNIAWNYHQYGFTTFDGVNATNGVQFLWFVILVALAAVAPTKTALLMATMVLVIALNAACYYPVWRIGRALDRPGLAVVMALPLLYLNLTSTTYVTGMENSLHLFVLLAFVAVLLAAMQRAAAGTMSAGDVVTLTILLALTVWVRIDSAMYVVPLYAYVLWLYARRSRTWQWRPVVLSAAIAGTMAVVMFAVFYAMAGTPVPISGLVKQAMFNEGPVANLPQVTGQVLKEINPFFSELVEIARSVEKGRPVTPDWVGITALGLIAVVVPWLLLERHRRRIGRPDTWLATIAPLPELFAVLLIATLPHFLYISSYPFFMVWYHSPYVVLGILATGLALHRIAWLARPLPAEGIAPRRWTERAVACMAAGAVLTTGWSLARENLTTVERNPNTKWSVELSRERMRIARWIDAHLDQDIVLAAWNAGVMGYYSNRRLINLDGLVNGPDYYREVLLRQRTKVLPDYLRRNGVSLILDRTIYDYDISEDFAPVHVSGGFRQMRIFRRKDLGPAGLPVEVIPASAAGS